jgi:Transcription factor Tfb2
MDSGPKSSRLVITARGFQFLLEDVNTQLWGLLLRYLGMVQERQMDLVDVFRFLFMLGSLELGRVCLELGMVFDMTWTVSLIYAFLF